MESQSKPQVCAAEHTIALLVDPTSPAHPLFLEISGIPAEMPSECYGAAKASPEPSYATQQVDPALQHVKTETNCAVLPSFSTSLSDLPIFLRVILDVDGLVAGRRTQFLLQLHEQQTAPLGGTGRPQSCCLRSISSVTTVRLCSCAKGFPQTRRCAKHSCCT